MHNDANGYGSDHYVYRDGVRHIAGLTRTLRPVGHETNALFEERMDILAQRLSAMADVRDCEIEIERRGGAAVQATVRVRYTEPIPAPIAQDERMAGGRIEARGSRGSGALSFALQGL
jgi:hypothetical protein